MNRMGKGIDDKAGWLAAVVEENVLGAMVQMGQIGTAIYRGALAENLTAIQAKDVTEATMAAIFKAGAVANPQGSGRD